MAHNIEIRNGVASYAENAKKERAWHKLGEGQQIFDRPMFVNEALSACHADYNVELQPVVALSNEVLNKVSAGEMISAEEIMNLIIPKRRATMRTDIMRPLGVVGDGYGIVQNKTAFEFVDTLCSGKITDRDNTPVIETCGVLGNGERVFVTAKFPKRIVMDAKRDDLIEMYVVFTTSHDGTGAVKCVVTPVRTVCNNTLQLALRENVGRISMRHSSGITQRLDLTNKENAEFAYKTLHLYEVYESHFKECLEHLKNVKVSSRQLDNILANLALSEENIHTFRTSKNINHPDISSRGRNIFLNMKEAIHSSVGQDIQERGTGLWVVNGVSSYFQNVANFTSNEKKFDSIMDGNAGKKVQMAMDLCLAI